MTEKRFSFWQVAGILFVALALMAASLGSGVALGYQWGRASGLAAARAAYRAEGADPPHALPFRPEGELPDLASQPYLGVEFETITPELAESEKLSVDSGAIIRTVVSGGPAEKAGVKVEDIVLEVSGQSVDADHTLRDRVMSYRPGDDVTLTLRRGSETQEIKVTLGERAGFGEPFEPGFHYEFRCGPQPCPFPFFHEQKQQPTY